MKKMTIVFKQYEYDTIKQLSQYHRRSFASQVHFLIDEGIRMANHQNGTKPVPKSSIPKINDSNVDDLEFDE